MADALKEEIIEHIYMSEKYNEVMHDLVSEALDSKLGEIDEDLYFELGMCIMDRIELKWYEIKELRSSVINSRMLSW